ncbi:MAG TPA: bifunctional diguanylate cyclase/phosphodiesterase [Rubrivivax sp.]|nr:bifunctional diguanylate cyclase/phosphodiesterase [Rubrivivax sp.]
MAPQTVTTMLAQSGIPAWALAAALLAVGAALALVWQQARSSRRLQVDLLAANSKLDELRGRDPLTGLLTRTELERVLDTSTRACDRGTTRLSVLYVGLDNFRPLNEAYGHEVGDALLAEAARRIKSAVGLRPVAARVGGDEFALLVGSDLIGAGQAAGELLGSLQRPYRIEQLELQLTASVGIAVYPEHGSRPRLLVHAALAMRSVKMDGGAGHALFHPAMDVDLRDQAEMLQDLRHAMRRGELELYYQPKIDARSLQVTAAEALLRWKHPQRGMISPGVFIPLAERHGLIGSIGQWVIEEACRQAAQWRERGLRMRVAVNISGQQLRQDDLVQLIEAALDRHGIPPGRMTCEITESVAMEDTRQTRAAFERLRRAGLHVSIDDFGTGHSSLAALRRLPAAELKIDRAFVTDLATSAEARSIVQAVMQLARTLDLRVVAEGVETEAQLRMLVAQGCDEAQGYLFTRPLPPPELETWLLAQRD